MDTSGLNVDKIKQNVMDYWRSEAWNWPVKIVSAARGTALSASAGRVVEVTGYVTSEKFVRGRSLDQVEKILGLKPGDLQGGAVIMRLNSIPQPGQFELRGYTQTPGGEVYTGGEYPPGLGANQWQLIVKVPATVLKVIAPGGKI